MTPTPPRKNSPTGCYLLFAMVASAMAVFALLFAFGGGTGSGTWQFDLYPEGGAVLASQEEGKSIRVDLSTGQITPVPSVGASPTVLRDGTVITDSWDGSVHRLKSVGGGRFPLPASSSNGVPSYAAPAASANGDSVYAIRSAKTVETDIGSQRPVQMDLVRIERSGQVTPLAKQSLDFMDFQPGCEAKGRVYYVSEGPTPATAYWVSSDGKSEKVHRWGEAALIGVDDASGRVISALVAKAGLLTLWISDLDGKGRRKVTESDGLIDQVRLERGGKHFVTIERRMGENSPSYLARYEVASGKRELYVRLP